MTKVRVAVLALAGLLLAAPLLSHDFWLIPNAFRVAPGGELVVLGQTSSEFPTTLSAVTVDRVASASVLTASSELEIDNLDLSGNSLRLRQRLEQAGQAIIQVAVHPREIPESAESFRRYLTLEGAPEALERYEREGILPVDSITRRYAKYAKAIVEVGNAGPRAYSRVAEHPLEFVPLSDPGKSGEGQELRFRILFRGSPSPTQEATRASPSRLMPRRLTTTHSSRATPMASSQSRLPATGSGTCEPCTSFRRRPDRERTGTCTGRPSFGERTGSLRPVDLPTTPPPGPFGRHPGCPRDPSTKQ